MTEKTKSTRKVAQSGAGTLYQRAGSPYWWFQFYLDGVKRRESTGKTSLEDAIKHRDRVLGRKVRGEIGAQSSEKITVDALLNHFLDSSKKRVRPPTLKIYRYVVEAHLRPAFGRLRALKVTTKHLDDYREMRTKVGATGSTANRELTLLRIAFRGSTKTHPPLLRLDQVPMFEMVSERDNTRTGFVTDQQFASLLVHLPDYLKPLVVVAYNTGIRKGELLKLVWAQIDFDAQLIRLHKTKNGEWRSVPFIGDMEDVLTIAKADRDELCPHCAHVFSRFGDPIKSFQTSWTSATKKAGVPDLLFHDLRRSGVRNLIRSGVPETIAMAISGHKTRAVFDRYNIVSESDLQDAAEKMRKFRAVPQTDTSKG